MGVKRRQTQAPEEETGSQQNANVETLEAHHVDANTQQHPIRDAVHQQTTYNNLIMLHRNRCWDWRPSAVVAASACPEAPLVVVGLESGDIELWDLSFMTCLQRVVGNGTEVTALAWAKDSLTGVWRTFAATLDGSLCEISWTQSRIVASTDSGAGTVWSLVAQPFSSVRPGFNHQLVAACDDGSVRLFSVEGGEPGLIYDRVLAMLQGRALAAAWHPSGAAVVAGGADGCIHALDAATGIETMRITAGISTSQPVCVWRLLVLPDDTIVSGDSSGAVQFWDGKFGSLLHRFNQHAADILALAASPDGNNVFASGVDSQVVMFSKSSQSILGDKNNSWGKAQQSQWVYTHYKRPHSHDVRFLEVVRFGSDRDMLLSGGADAQLMIYPVGSFLQTHPARLTKCPQRPICSITGSAFPRFTSTSAATRRTPKQQAQHTPKLITCQKDVIDVWQPGSVAGTDTNDLGSIRYHHHYRAQQQQQRGGYRHQEGDVAELIAAPRHLARITCKAGHVTAAHIAPNGTYVACSAGSKGSLRVYQLQPTTSETGQPSGLTSVSVNRKQLDSELQGVVSVLVTNEHVLAATHSGVIHVLEMPGHVNPSGQAASEDIVSSLSVSGTVKPWDNTTMDTQRPKLGKQTKRTPDWSMFSPSINSMCASSDGSLIAVAGPVGVAFLARTKSTEGTTTKVAYTRKGNPFPHHSNAPVTSMAFNDNATLLAAVMASGHLLVLDTTTVRPIAWCLENDTLVSSCLERLPGALQGVCFAPGFNSHLLVIHSAGGFCLLDASTPLDANVVESKKRARGPNKPVHGPTQAPGAGPIVEANAAGTARATTARQQRDGNGRTVLLSDSVAFVGFSSPSELLLLEKSWDEVLNTLPPPLFRQRYGN